MSRWNQNPAEEFIDGTPFLWKDSLTQGNTGVIVVPTDLEYANIVKQAHALDPVSRLLGGIKITSWLRSPSHNKAIGGAVHSMHLTGLATDFTPLHCTPEEARVKIKQAGIYPGRGEEGTPTWVHLDLKNNVWFKP